MTKTFELILAPPTTRSKYRGDAVVRPTDVKEVVMNDGRRLLYTSEKLFASEYDGIILGFRISPKREVQGRGMVADIAEIEEGSEDHIMVRDFLKSKFREVRLHVPSQE